MQQAGSEFRAQGGKFRLVRGRKAYTDLLQRFGV